MNIINRRSAYTLRRRSDGKYLSNPTYGKIKINDTPTPVYALSTARSHRIHALLNSRNDSEHFDEIVIENIWITIETDDVVVENPKIIAKLARLCKHVSIDQPRFDNIRSILNIIEDLMHKNVELMNYRYAVVVTDHPTTPFEEMSCVINVAKQDNVYLLEGESDLFIFRMYSDSDFYFVYDFVTDTIS